MNAKQIVCNDMIYLINCALHGQIPEEVRIKNMQLGDLYSFAKYHCLETIVYMTLASGMTSHQFNELPEETRGLLKEWKKEREQDMRGLVLFDIEREQILQFMEDKGIWYMPLKGILLKNIYPSPEMRQMADNDILFDKAFAQDIYVFMTERGYKAIEYNESNHDEYIRRPSYNFEMHKELFSEEHDQRWQDYYRDVKNRLIKDDNNSYGYHFSDEDFYIYNTTHAYNHYIRKGTGFRTLIDFYLYIDTYGERMDWKYIEGELEKLGVAEFEKNIRKLSQKVFGEPDKFDLNNLKDEDRDMFQYIFLAGTYGTTENYVKYKMKKLQDNGQELSGKTRLKYLRTRIFPGLKYMEKYYPIAYRHRWMIPFVYIYRIFRGIFWKRKKCSEEFRTVLKK